ncbi:GntR family transcriptional regulator [Gemmobacter aquaticus]|uniref:GntR family transcriptional regulator n=1 Tax=Gemmobacter aquaticus TaxID=490185 RepID=A0A918DCJ3_9RHOB|nr:FadR/GntR family transcriptional regulator [Gemmobacter aquaticus]GGO32219.1 GntR family transcriptional regulator [Gemmobacter aquaticus]
MAITSSTEAAAPQGQTLVVQVRDAIRAQIVAGQFKPGDRLPSEARLTQDFGVSRTVVREAIAALRSDGLVEPRQGAGVFVLTPPSEEALPFRNLDLARVSSLIEMLELRTAVEGDAAGLAALRRSPAQEEKIIEAFERFCDLARRGEPTSEADFAFHTVIAEATNNPRFSEFLRMIGQSLIPRRAVSDEGDPRITPEYSARLIAEHEAVVIAIQNGDEAGAREAMRAHLKNSQARYRQFLREQRR